MNDSIIILPDEDFIKKLTEEFREQDSQPEALYVDGYTDLPYFLMTRSQNKTFDNLEEGPVTPETAGQSGVRLFASAISCQDIYNGEKAYTHFRQNLEFAKKAFENIIQVKNRQQINELKDNMESAGTVFILKNSDVLADNLNLILSLRDHGIYTASLTHKGTNRLADGDMIRYSDGITQEGREVIKGLIDNNILIDVAHLHPSCFWQLMKLVEAPCVAAGTGIRERCDIPGNLDLLQIKEITEREGLVGITFNPELLSKDKKADIEDIFVHMDTVVQKFGPDRVAICSGFGGYDSFSAGMEDYTGVKALKKAMSRRGYNEEDIEKIMGKNWINIYERIM